MRKILFRQIFSWLSIASLFLQTLTPFTSLIPQAYAQEVTPTDTVAPTSTPTDTVTPTPANTTTPAPTDTITPTTSPTDTVTPAPTDTVTPTDTTAPTPVVTDTPTQQPTDTAAPTTDTTSNNSSQGPPVAVSPTNTPVPSVTPTITPGTTSSDASHVAATLLPNTSAPSLDLTSTQTSSATLTTNKADYAPTDTVLISGTGFTANKAYNLEIVSADQPAVDFTTQVTAKSDGSIAYAYQLDGHYRPNYAIYVKDGSVVVASTTFTDSAGTTTTVSGVACIADQPGQSGLVCTANDTSISSVSSIVINGHGCRFPGDTVSFTANWQINVNATSRYNMGLWFATAGQTSALHGTCSATSLPSSPSPFFDANPSYTPDTCGDINSGNTGTLSITQTAVCNPDSSGFLKLPYCTSWQQNEQYNGNNAETCKTPTDTVPGTGSKCSCNDGFSIPITVPPSVEVIKSLSPSNDSGLFNLQVNGVTASTSANVGNGGDTGKVGVSTGSATFGETAGTNTLLGNYTSSASCVNRKDSSSVTITGNGPTWTIPNVINGQDIVCTITNTRNNGTIELKKVWSGAGGQTTLNIGTTANGTDIASQLTGTAGVAPLTTGTKSVNIGTYYVSESGGLSNYTSALACTDNNNPVIPGANNSVSVASGHTVICTFTNTLQQAHLTLVKTVTNDNGGSVSASAWTLTATGNTNISGTTGSGTVTNAAVLPGTYTLGENSGPTGYTAGTYSCVVNNQSPVSNNSVTLANGDNATCTVNNNDNAPSLTLVKQVSNTHGGTATAGQWTLTATGASGSPTNLSGTTPVTSGSNFKADTYALAESGGPSGYTASNWSCTGGITVTNSQITLGLGQTTTCTITNSDIAPTLKLSKTVSNTHGGTSVASDWTMTATGSSNTFSDAGNSSTFHTVTAGIVYTLTESGPTGYSAGSWSCDKGSLSGNQLTLGVGQNATCNITNLDVAPTLKLSKTVANNNGGTSTSHAWTLSATGSAGFSDFGDSSTFHTVTAGVTYTLGETGPSGYSAGNWSCSAGNLVGNQLTLSVGQTNVTCSITNSDIAPTLKLVKSVTNDNGGTATSAAWTLTATGTGGFSDSGNSTAFHTVLANTAYTLSESGPSGYTAGSWNCNGGNLTGNSLTLGLNQNVTCIIVNNDNAPSLTLVKQVINTHGGSASASAWTLTATGTGGSPTNLSGTTGVTSGSNFKADTYTLAESNGPSGYSASSWTCTNGVTVTNSQITLTLGKTTTCTITNSDIAPQLTVIKHVINNNGGSLSANNFTMTVDGTNVSSPTFGGDESGTTVTLNQGSYTVGEVAADGYQSSFSKDCSGTISVGQTKTCTVTNSDLPATLTLVKSVTNDNGGTALATDWTLSATGPTSISGITGTGAVTSAPVSAGIYSLSESGPSGYTASSWSCVKNNGDPIPGSLLSLANGDTATCTIVNNDNAPSLTLNKVVNNANGGQAASTDWTLSATGSSKTPTNLSGTTPVTSDSHFKADTYTLAESNGPSGYSASSWTCTNGVIVTNNQITLALGQSTSCTITNSDIAPTLKLVKSVTNNNGGTRVPGDWDLSATGNSGFTDAGNSTTFHTVLANVSYTLSESGPSGYTASSWNCDGGNLQGSTLTLGLNQNVTCTITNDDIAPSLTLIKEVDNQEVGTAATTDFTLTATGPTTLSGAGGAVSDASFSAGTYTLSESGPDGYTPSSWGCLGGSQDGNSLTLGLGESAVCTITNTRDTGSITVHKKVDTTGTGVFDGDDTTAASLGFNWSLDNGSANDFGTSINGVSTLDTHTISESLANKPYHFVGWYPTSSKDFNCAQPEGTSLPSFALQFNGDSRDITLCNARDTGTIVINKVVEDPNGKVVTNDPTLFSFNVSQNNATVDSAEIAGGQSDSFTVPTGNYDVTETPVDGYKLLGCHAQYESEEIGNSIQNGESVSVFTNESVIVTCTNQQELPILTITKTNDKLGIDQHAGDSVLYTLTVTATQAATANVTVTDLLPNGFHYRNGSATIDTGDGSGPHAFTNFIDVYHSPAIWNIGNMNKDETVTLTLIADIDGSEQAGDYKDLAWAKGTPVSDSSLVQYATAENSWLVNGNFVGTHVNVVSDQQTGAAYNVTHTVQQSVLGASTFLPDTGADALWIYVGLGLLTIGGASLIIGYRKRREILHA